MQLSVEKYKMRHAVKMHNDREIRLILAHKWHMLHSELFIFHSHSTSTLLLLYNLIKQELSQSGRGAPEPAGRTYDPPQTL